MLSIFNQTFTPHPQITNSIRTQYYDFTCHDMKHVLTNIVCLLSSRVGNSRVLSLAPSPGGNQLLSCLVPRNRFLHLPSRTHCSALLRLVFPGEATTWALEYGVQQFVAILY
jgi:hypothetical protein